MTAYNEADIILPSILRLLSQDIAVHLIDNWSDDASEQIIQPLVKGLYHLRAFRPRAQPPTTSGDDCWRG